MSCGLSATAELLFLCFVFGISKTFPQVVKNAVTYATVMDIEILMLVCGK